MKLGRLASLEAAAYPELGKHRIGEDGKDPIGRWLINNSDLFCSQRFR